MYHDSDYFREHTADNKVLNVCSSMNVLPKCDTAGTPALLSLLHITQN